MSTHGGRRPDPLLHRQGLPFRAEDALLIAETIILIPFLVSRLRDPGFKMRQKEMMESGAKWIWMGAIFGALISSVSLISLAAMKVVLHVANAGLLIYLFFISDWENPYGRLFKRATE